MSILLNYKFKRLGKWLIWLGFFTSIGLAVYDCTTGDCCDPNLIGTRDYGWLIMSAGIILYIVSKDKMNDEYLNELKIRAGGIVIVLTIILGAVFDFLNSGYTPSLGDIVFFQFMAYYLIYKIISKDF